MTSIVLATGGFDPIHSGHISYLKSARNLGQALIVGVNSDAWLIRKKGRAFMPMQERMEIVKNIKGVDFVIDFDDADGSARNAIWMVRQSYPNHRIIFANGGDRTNANIPEMDFVDANMQFVFGVGGDNKVNSSSCILNEWKTPRTDRPWGYYRVLHTPNAHTKVKELTVLPGQRLSMQRHEMRSESWFVAEGNARVLTVNTVSTDVEELGVFSMHETVAIHQHQWHQLCNDSDNEVLKIIEIQYGPATNEEDIERI